MERKILIHSNSPLAGTGYGNQTFVFSRLLKKAGWKVYISAFYGLQGNQLDWDGITILPKGLDAWGNDILGAHFESLKPNVLFALMDSWVLSPDVIKRLPLALWTPIDHDTAPPQVIRALNNVAFPIAMSKHGERAMRYHGIDPFYIPHGVDTSIFKPVNRKQARKRFAIDDKKFVVAMNAANKGVPSRKNFESVFKAWSVFVKRHPDAIMYCHTMPLGATTGYELPEVLKFYNIADGEVLFPNVYDYVQGHYGWDYLRDMYAMADVLLAPSKGEGFGIPVVEAHATGCPTITTDKTAQMELNAHYQIKVDPLDDLTLSPQMAEWANVRPSQILEALEEAYENRGDETIRAEARDRGLLYDSKKVFAENMTPVFDLISQMSYV